MTLRMMDTFSGIGGFSLAARLLGGFETVQFVEQEAFCQQILRKHWPHVPIHNDICTFKPSKGSADVIVGGFPCQDISNVGKRAGLSGERSGLFYELLRVIRLVEPRYVVLENVSAIVQRGLADVLSSLAEAGYDAEWACISASDVGACHRRERWWCVAYPTENQYNEETFDTVRNRLERPDKLEGCQTQWPAATFGLFPDWTRFISKPIFRAGDDGFSNRMARLKAVGNAVVPQVATIPLARVLELEKYRFSKAG